MRIEHKQGKQLKERFDSWGEFLDYVSSPFEEHGKQACKRGSHIKDDSDGDWHGTRDFKGAIKLATDGWLEGIAKARKISEPMFNHVSHLIERVDPVFDVEGGSLDIGRYNAGDPEMFQRFENVIVEAAGNRVIRMLYNVSASGGISGEVITAKGAAIASLIELLEYAGNRVELSIGHTVEQNREDREKDKERTLDTIVVIKAADQPLDIGRIAFALANPACLRRLFFSNTEHAPSDIFIFLPSYGYPSDFPKATIAEYDIYCGKAGLWEPQWSDTSAAEAWILKTLAEQGVSIKKDEAN